MAYDYSYVQSVQIENTTNAQLLKKTGNSYIVALAIVLGKIADKMTDNLMDLARGLDKLQAEKANGAKDPKFNGMSENELTAFMQAQTQLLNMFMQAMNTVLKTFGESNKDVARKQ